MINKGGLKKAQSIKQVLRVRERGFSRKWKIFDSKSHRL